MNNDIQKLRANDIRRLRAEAFNALRNFEEAHRKWMNTSVFSDAHKFVKAEKDHTLAVYSKASQALRDAGY
jgi:hypothetical protein